MILGVLANKVGPTLIAIAIAVAVGIIAAIIKGTGLLIQKMKGK